MLRDFLARNRCGAIAIVVLAAVGSQSLSACGVKGPLKLPTAPAAASGARPSDAPSVPPSIPSQESSAVPAQASPAEPEPQPPATRP